MNTPYNLTYSLTGIGLKEFVKFKYIVRKNRFYSFYNKLWDRHNVNGYQLSNQDILLTFKMYRL